MADPSKYTQGYDFSNFADSNPTTPLPGDRLDNELANISASTDELRLAVMDIRRSDGALKNGIVTADSLSPSLTSVTGSWEGPWGSGTAYTVNQSVSNDGSSYICTVAHTSGASTEPGVGASWATYWDLTASKGGDGADGASGTIGGSTGSTDNRLLRADGTGGATLQASAITVDDSGNMSGVGTFNGYTPREVFTANRTYYVSTSGSDSNDGLTVGAPFATIQKAWNVLVTKDLNGFTATIKLADGTYTAGLNATVPVIGGPVVIDGNSSTPTNVLLGPTGSAIQVVCAANVTLKNFKLTSTIYGVVSRFGGVVYSGTGMEYGTNTVDMWRSDNGGYIGSAANFTISGGGQKGFEALRGGIIEVAGVTITLTGTPNYSNAFAKADGGTVYFWSPGTTWSGSATGKRYDAIGNGVVNSFGAATTWLPGSVAGTTSTGGQYV